VSKCLDCFFASRDIKEVPCDACHYEWEQYVQEGIHAFKRHFISSMSRALALSILDSLTDYGLKYFSSRYLPKEVFTTLVTRADFYRELAKEAKKQRRTLLYWISLYLEKDLLGDEHLKRAGLLKRKRELDMNVRKFVRSLSREDFERLTDVFEVDLSMPLPLTIADMRIDLRKRKTALLNDIASSTIIQAAEIAGMLTPQPELSVLEDEIKEEKEMERPAQTESAAKLIEGLQALVGEALMTEDKVKDIVTQVANEIIKRPVIREIKFPDKPKVKMEEHTHPVFEDVLTLAGLGQNIMLIGPAGCGKTHLAIQIAKALDRPFASVSCSIGMSESALTGRLVPTGDNGKFEYMISDFVRLYQEGGVFLFDEIDAADANLLVVINQALANDGFHIGHKTDGTYVKRHKDFVCIAAANTFGTGGDMLYAGRERLDAATLDRFEPVLVDYDTELEKKLVDEELLAWAAHVREVIAKNKLRRVMSTRKLLNMTAQLNAGMSSENVKNRYLSTWTKDERGML